MNSLTGYLIGALLVVGGAFYIYYLHEKQNKLEEELDLYKRSTDVLAAQLTSSHSSYLEQKGKFAKERETSAKLRKEIKRLKEGNKDVQVYLDTVSPSELSDRMRGW